ncbi:MAG: hypothetical protein KGV44_01695 [Flavobacteriaceae bacterium]|nr:hypothetical protein [Flavobacteriaceae bacterium]
MKKAFLLLTLLLVFSCHKDSNNKGTNSLNSMSKSEIATLLGVKEENIITDPVEIEKFKKKVGKFIRYDKIDELEKEINSFPTEIKIRFSETISENSIRKREMGYYENIPPDISGIGLIRSRLLSNPKPLSPFKLRFNMSFSYHDEKDTNDKYRVVVDGYKCYLTGGVKGIDYVEKSKLINYEDERNSFSFFSQGTFSIGYDLVVKEIILQYTADIGGIYNWKHRKGSIYRTDFLR